MNEKIYAKKIYCEDNYIYWLDIKDNEYYNDIFIYGNEHYEGLNGEIIKWIYNELLNYSDYEKQFYYKNNAVVMIIDLLHTQGIKINIPYALKVNKIINDYNSFNHYCKEDAICNILSIIMKKKYNVDCMKGYSQGDWQYIYYPENKKDAINYIESVYWNTGSEIMIHEEENIPSNANEINGFCFYTSSYKVEDIKEDIKRECGFCGSIDNIIFFDIKDVSYRQVIDIEYKEGE